VAGFQVAVAEKEKIFAVFFDLDIKYKGTILMSSHETFNPLKITVTVCITRFNNE
jgi:hypothetical protein